MYVFNNVPKLNSIASNISYEPFGDVKTMTYGNGVVRTVNHD